MPSSALASAPEDPRVQAHPPLFPAHPVALPSGHSRHRAPCPLPPCLPGPGPLLLTPSWLWLQSPDPGRCRPGASLTSSLSPTHPSSLSPRSVYRNIDLVMAVRDTGLPANRDDQRSGPLPVDSDGTVLLSHPLSWPSAPISYCGARLAPDAADPPSMSASETVDGRLQFFPGLGLGYI